MRPGRRKTTPIGSGLDTHLPTRTVIRIENKKARRTVFCQVRQLDANFVKRYNGPIDSGVSRRKIDS